MSTTVSLVAVASTMMGLSHQLSQVQAQPTSCLKPAGAGFTLELGGTCNYDTILNAFESFFNDPLNGVGSDCTHSAKDDLAILLGGSDPEDAARTVCLDATANGPRTPFYRAAKKSANDDDLAFEQLYYNGATSWNELVQTIVPKDPQDVVQESGVCLGDNGRQQNRNVVTLKAGNEFAPDNTSACYELCVEYQKANAITACMAIWNTGTDDGCYAHTEGVLGGTGNVDDTAACWVMGIEDNVLKHDAYTVGSFLDFEATVTQLDWPGTLTNFDLQQCDASAAMCCWVADRQAQDNNGNCNAPEDENCVNRDPGDNADLCYVSHPDGNLSSKFDSTNGFSGFPGDDNNNSDEAEGPIHCHGFAWANDELDFTNRYKANNLFFVSMYDHMYQRGYVRNILGAPMCACIEQMPVVDRSDCTQIDVEEDYTVVYDGQNFHGSLNQISVDFNSCQGYDRNGNNRNNDLWGYFNRLYKERKVTAKQFGMVARRLVERGHCHPAMEFHLATEHSLVIGYNHDPAKWTFAAGKGAFKKDNRPEYLKESFKAAWNISGKNVVMRKCADCNANHQTIFYKRLTPIPEDGSMEYDEDLKENWDLSDFIRILKDYYDGANRFLPGHEYGVDFEIYSSLEDAEAGVNEWQCENYKYTEGFPGDCAPNGGTSSNQEAMFHHWWRGRKHAAWYFPNDPDQTAITYVTESQDIGLYKGVGQTIEKDGTFYITGTGQDIWSQADGMHFMSTPMTGDVTVTVKVASIQNPDYWTKAGLMIRRTLEADSAHFSAMLTPVQDVYLMARNKDGEGTWGTRCAEADGCAANSYRKEAWLQLTTRMGVFNAYQSIDDGVTWSKIGDDYTFANLGQGEFHVGLAFTSHNNDRYGEAVFEHYEVESYYYPSASPTTTFQPTPFVNNIDIGIESCPDTCAGTSAFRDPKILITSNAADIWNNKDHFHFYKGDMSLTEGTTGDFDAVAHLVYWKPVQQWSKAGIMVRDSTNANAANCFVMLPGYHDPVLQWRSGDGQWAAGTSPLRWWSYVQDVWLKLERRGDVCTGFQSQDGGTTWEQVGQIHVIMPSASTTGIQVGLAVTANQAGSEAEAHFEDYSVTPITVTS